MPTRCFIISAFNLILIGDAMTSRLLYFSFIFLVFSSTQRTYSQWTLITTSSTINVHALVVDGNNLYVGDLSQGIYLSTNNGTSWLNSNQGLTNYTMTSILKKGTYLFAGTFDGPFRSSDNGTTWTPANNGLSVVYSFSINNDTIYAAGSYLGAFRSADNGTTWESLGLNRGEISLLVAKDSMLFAISDYGYPVTGHYYYDYWLSIYNNQKWSSRLCSSYVNALIIKDDNLYLGTDDGVASVSNNADWSSLNSGLTDSRVTSFASSGSYLFAGTANGRLFFSSDNGAHWSDGSAGLPAIQVYALAVSGDNLFAGIGNGNIGRDTLLGVWRRSITDITTVKNSHLLSLSGYLLEQNYPNPFNPITTISFSLPHTSKVKITIYNSLGVLVKTLVNQDFARGNYSKIWDASKEPSGIYFYRLQAGNFVQTRKLVLLK